MMLLCGALWGSVGPNLKWKIMKFLQKIGGKSLEEECCVTYVASASTTHPCGRCRSACLRAARRCSDRSQQCQAAKSLVTPISRSSPSSEVSAEMGKPGWANSRVLPPSARGGTNVRLPPDCAARLPPDCSARLPPDCAARLPPDCAARLPPDCSARLPPDCSSAAL